MIDINALKKSSRDMNEFVTNVRSSIISELQSSNKPKDFTAAIQNCIEELYAQNFDIKQFGLHNLDDDGSLVRVIEKQYNRSDIALSMWSHFHDHKYLLDDADPDGPVPALGQDATTTM